MNACTLCICSEYTNVKWVHACFIRVEIYVVDIMY